MIIKVLNFLGAATAPARIFKLDLNQPAAREQI
jgi:hypothetical protein